MRTLERTAHADAADGGVAVLGYRAPVQRHRLGKEILRTVADASTSCIASPIQCYLETLIDELADDRSGAVADYIPELAAADPDRFGICLATIDGACTRRATRAQPFTIQSMSKPFTYGARARRPRPGRVGAARRRAVRRRVQLDQPRAGHGTPAATR